MAGMGCKKYQSLGMNKTTLRPSNYEDTTHNRPIYIIMILKDCISLAYIFDGRFSIYPVSKNDEFKSCLRAIRNTITTYCDQWLSQFDSLVPLC